MGAQVTCSPVKLHFALNWLWKGTNQRESWLATLSDLGGPNLCALSGGAFLHSLAFLQTSLFLIWRHESACISLQGSGLRALVNKLSRLQLYVANETFSEDRARASSFSFNITEYGSRFRSTNWNTMEVFIEAFAALVCCFVTSLEFKRPSRSSRNDLPGEVLNGDGKYKTKAK